MQSLDELNIGKGVDLLILLRIIKKLVTPFNKTAAFEAGLIDAKGKKLKKAETPTEKAAMSTLDVFILNMKRLLSKVPFGASKLASLGTALFLLREYQETQKTGKTLNEMEMFKKFIKEDGSPTNNVGDGNVAIPSFPIEDEVVMSRFGNHDVFDVDRNTFAKCRTCKPRFGRFAKSVGDGKIGQAIRAFAAKNPHKSIIIKNPDGAMSFLKIGRKGMKF